MEAAQTYADQPNPAEIWAILRETNLILKGSAQRQEEIELILKENAQQMKETDRRIERLSEETTRRHEEIELILKETDRRMKETARQMKETDRRIGYLGDRFGEMIEYMVKPNLIEKFQKLGFAFKEALSHSIIRDGNNKIIAEVDITLENDDLVMLVEVKSKPSIKDLKDHLKRMETVRLHAAPRGDKRKYLGAAAGMVIPDNVRNFALKNGFYVIEPSGETFIITPPEGSPREW
jgi:hypothetical protein